MSSGRAVPTLPLGPQGLLVCFASLERSGTVLERNLERFWSDRPSCRSTLFCAFSAPEFLPFLVAVLVVVVVPEGALHGRLAVVGQDPAAALPLHQSGGC